MVGFPLAGWRVGLDYQSYSPTFFQMKNRLGVFLLARQLSGGFVYQCGTPARFLQIRNGRESPIIGEPDSVAPPPVVADLMETVLLWFFFSFSWVP